MLRVVVYFRGAECAIKTKYHLGFGLHRHRLTQHVR